MGEEGSREVGEGWGWGRRAVGRWVRGGGGGGGQ